MSFVLFATSLALAAPTWSQITSSTAWVHDSDVTTSDAGAVSIDTTTIAGTPCFRAKTSTDASVGKLMETVSDIPGTKRWSTAGVTEAELLGKSGENWYYYQFLDVPGWTMSADRYWFLKGTYTTSTTQSVFRWERVVDGGAYKTKFDAVKAAHPDAVEPPVNVGGWVFEGAAPSVKITYYICTDSGGSIPVFVQTSATRRTLPDTLSDAVREAKKRMKSG